MTLQRQPADPPLRWAGRPEQRIGDLERDAVCHALSEHFTAGRLSPDEFDGRVELAIRARTEADLRGLLADLPAPPAPRPAVAPMPPVPDGAGTFDVMFALLGVMAGLCLMMLFMAGGGRFTTFGFFACLGGATVAAVITHFVHRAFVGRRR